MTDIEKTALRQALPEAARDLFDDVAVPRILGASAHIRCLSQIAAQIGRQNPEQPDLDLIHRTFQFFRSTRGQSSYAIVNGLNELEALIQSEIQTADNRPAGPAGLSMTKGEVLVQAAEQFQQACQQRAEQVVEYALELSRSFDKILVYDYSSTVNQLLARLPRDTEIIIPESRSLSGGLPFVKTSVQTHDHVRFIPDAALAQVLTECDAVMIGAETFYPDGTAFNTVGSEMAGLLARCFHVPYYVLTPIQKADLRPLSGGGRHIQPKDLKFRLADGLSEAEAERVDFRIRECVSIAPELITAYVTEYGILPPSGLLSVLMSRKPEYFEGGPL